MSRRDNSSQLRPNRDATSPREGNVAIRALDPQMGLEASQVSVKLGSLTTSHTWLTGR